MSSPALCNAPAGHVDWPALGASPKSIAICWNGTTASMRDAGRPKFGPSATTGSCSATAAPKGNRRLRSWRADRAVSRMRAVGGNVLLFSSGHFLRVLAVRWIGIELTTQARFFMLSTASLSAVGYEDSISRPVIRLWNETRHVEE